MARTRCLPLRLGVLWAALACASGCSENGGATSDAGNWDTICPPGLQPRGPACVPVLDDCTGDQVPVPGGGCEQVGVEECTCGIKGPPDRRKHIDAARPSVCAVCGFRLTITVR